VTYIGTGRPLLRVRRRALEPWALAGLALLLALAASWLWQSRPMLIELAAVLLLALPLLVSPRVRVVYLVVGTVAVFGTTGLTPSKLAFLFGAGVALVGALRRSRALAHTAAYKDLRPLLHASFVLLFVIVLSLPVSQLNGVPKKDWLRDVAPYVLLAWAPLFAFDAQSAFSLRTLRRMIALVGLGGAGIFMIHLLHGRQIATVYSGDAGLVTFLLTAALFSFAIAIVLDGEEGRLRWLALGSLVLAMLASTGTRSVATLLAAPFAIAIGTRRRMAQRSLRLAVTVPIAALLVVLGTQSLLKLTNADSSAVTQRIDILFRSGTTSDQSYAYRLREIHSAWALFKSEPVFGVGPGHVIPWRDDNGNLFQNTFVDPSVGFLPDYGIVGLFAVAFLVASFISVIRRLRRRTGERTTAQLGLLGFGAVVLAYSFLQLPFEDKGLSVGLLLLLAIAASEASERSDRASTGEAEA
jgi:O-antigen ligase